ncbi:hypothetical protein BHM03_00042793, partial [Ensete ventricosum]
ITHRSLKPNTFLTQESVYQNPRSLPQTAMAPKIPARIPPSLLARSLSFASSLAEKLPEAPSPANSAIDVSDTKRLFASVPTASLLHSLANLSAMAAGPLVDVGVAALRAALASEGQILRAAAIGVARATVHRHFCAGEGFEDAGHAVAGMWEEQGLRSILDYGMEDAEDRAACDRNLAGFLRTVEMASSLPPSSVSSFFSDQASVCVKITAICPISLLERVSDLLRWEQQDPTLQLPWKTNSIPVLCDSSPLYLTRSAPHPLTEMEECHLQLALQRLSKICERCTEANIQLLIDAEYTSVQPAIDYFTYAAAVRFNHGDHPIVFGTIQAYLRDSKERMVNAVQAAEREGVSLGVKLVRGAYITRETKLASSLGSPSPVHPSIQETHHCFNSCASFMLEKVRRGSGAVVLATHNVRSGTCAVIIKTQSLRVTSSAWVIDRSSAMGTVAGQIAAEKATELGIGRVDRKLQFAQLLGMADGLTYGLRNAGFQVSKYVPFGPVEQVMPYLLRRAEENRGLLCSSIVDRQLIRFMISNHCTTLSLLLCPASNFQNITLLCFLQEGDLEKTCHCSCLDDVVSLKSKVSVFNMYNNVL